MFTALKHYLSLHIIIFIALIRFSSEQAMRLAKNITDPHSENSKLALTSNRCVDHALIYNHQNKKKHYQQIANQQLIPFYLYPLIINFLILTH